MISFVTADDDWTTAPPSGAAGSSGRPGCDLPRRNPAGAEREWRTTMPTGTVKWFNTTKGYGFIAPDDGGKDVFVHISAVERAGLTGLADNQKVSYEMIEGRDGRKSAGDLKTL